MAPDGGLKGTPDLAKMLRYQPRDAAALVQIPSLIIDAEFEELIDRSLHGQAVAATIGKNAPARYETPQGTHYDLYRVFAEPATAMAIEWFRTYLWSPRCRRHLPLASRRQREGSHDASHRGSGRLGPAPLAMDCVPR